MRQKVLSILALLLMAVSGAWAQSVTEVSSFDALKTALEAGNSVKLTSDISCTSQISISGSVIIDGNGKTLTGSSSRAFSVSSSGALFAKNLTVTGFNLAGGGGAFVNSGKLVLEGCTLSDNHTKGGGYGGGAIENKGKLYASNTTFSGNYSGEIGGAINNYMGDLYLSGCTFSNNYTTSFTAKYGGAIGINQGSEIRIINCTFEGNKYGTDQGASDLGIYSSSSDYTIAGCSGITIRSDAALTTYEYGVAELDASDLSNIKFTYQSYGLFSVSATKKVFFSKGNLQLVGENTFQFAENQWDYFGSNQSDNHRDLFCWGTGNNPNQTTGNSTFTDWGDNTYLQATLGNGWSTMTKEEFAYVFNTRPSGSSVFDHADGRYTTATINTDGTVVKGIILFPDGITIAASEVTTPGTINGKGTVTECTTAQWAALAEKGCVFLPAAGFFLSGTGMGHGDITDYWSSTAADANKAYNLSFNFGYPGAVVNTAGSLGYNYGCSVRLVTDGMIKLDKNEAQMTIGNAMTLTATVVTTTGDKTVTWTTSDANVATVADGVVTAVAAGTATITATATKGTPDTGDDVSATCVVTVNPPKYDLTLADGSDAHGTVAFTVGGVAADKAKKDDVVTVSVTPADGYSAKDVTAKTSSQVVVPMTNGENGWTFTMPEDNVTVTVTYAKNLQNAWIQAIADQTYTGSAIEPTIEVKDGETTLTLNTDYTVAYSNNVETGTATVTVTGQGDYSGTATKTFRILANKTELNTAITEAETYYNSIKDDHAEAAAALKTAIDNAKAMQEKGDATQEEVNNALSALTTAKTTAEDAVLTETKTALNNDITAAEAYYESIKDGHTAAAATLLEAINAAKAVKDKADATQSEVDAAIATLAGAKTTAEQTVLTETKTALNDDITATETYYESIKNDHSEAAATLLEAINAAKTVKDKADATQSEVDAAIAALASAKTTAEQTVLTETKTALNDAITEAEAYYNSIKDDHADAANDLKDAIDAAKAVKDNTNATQEQVDAAIAALASAKTTAEQTVLTETKTALNDAIDEAEGYYNSIKESNPTAAATFLEAINNAKAVKDKADATQSEVDAAIATLAAAKTTAEQTVLTETKNELNDDITEAEAYYNSIKDDHTAAANTLKDAIDAAKGVKDNAGATQAEVDAAIAALASAKTTAEQTVLTETKNELNDDITEAEAYYNSIKDDHTAAANTLKDAIDAAKGVKDNAGATQAEVDAAIAALASAKTTAEQTVLTETKNELNDDITEAETYCNSITEVDPDAAVVLQAAIDAAKAVQGNANATQSEVESAAQTLNEAVDAAKADVALKRVKLVIPAKSYVSWIDAEKRQIETPVSGVSLHTVAAVSDKQVQLTDELSVMAAGKPYLIYNGGDAEANVSIILSSGDADNVDYDSEHFKGTLEPKTFTAEEMQATDHYVLQNGHAFVWVEQPGTLAAGKCWIEIAKPSASQARRLTIVVGGTQTSISTVKTAADKMDGEWYDLSGRRVAQPAKGIYVKNGRKVIVRSATK